MNTEQYNLINSCACAIYTVWNLSSMEDSKCHKLQLRENTVMTSQARGRHQKRRTKLTTCRLETKDQSTQLPLFSIKYQNCMLLLYAWSGDLALPSCLEYPVLKHREISEKNKSCNKCSHDLLSNYAANVLPERRAIEAPGSKQLTQRNITQIKK